VVIFTACSASSGSTVCTTPNGTSIQAEGIKPDIALADLAVNKADSAPILVSSEADLPNHLANEDSRTGQDIDNDGSAENAKLATQDYALSQALNVLKGMALNRTVQATPH
jgi:carboxyl-terminal processing protease